MGKEGNSFTHSYQEKIGKRRLKEKSQVKKKSIVILVQHAKSVQTLNVDWDAEKCLKIVPKSDLF